MNKSQTKNLIRRRKPNIEFLYERLYSINSHDDCLTAQNLIAENYLS